MNPLMSASDKLGRPNSYLRDGQRWIRFEQGRFERGMFRLGKLRSDAPPEAHLVQEISRRLHEAYQERDDEGPDGEWSFRDGLSFRKIAHKCGITERALHDLWHGQSWPKLRTIARVEMVLNDMLWNSQHTYKYREKLDQWRSQPAAVQQEWELP